MTIPSYLCFRRFLCRSRQCGAVLPFVQVLFRSTLTDIDYGKADT